MQWVEIDAREAVERAALARGREQRDVRVLSVEVDQRRGLLRERGCGDQPAVAVGT